MQQVWTVVVVAAVAVLSVLPPATAAPLTSPPSAEPRLVGATTPMQVQELDEAVALFAAADLVLPEVEVEFHQDRAVCKGYEGLFSARPEPWKIDICSELSFVVVHELAHAWIRANVDAQTKTDYLALRNLAAWNDPSVPWMERGTEDAAFVMQQVLQVRPAEPTERWMERFTAFELLVHSDAASHRRAERLE